MGRGFYDGWAPYVPVAERRRQAERKAAELKKKGQACQPVVIAGRTIARSFWGRSWCDNLEAYSDFANRLPRGRTYVRNGSVIDLRIDTGQVNALVSGSEVYQVEISVRPLEAAEWSVIVKECTGKVASLIEVLQGRLSNAVMEVVTRQGKGLFPRPRQLGFSCSCPDGASMCKHVAATLYGVGARLDNEPELLFRLRHVEPQDLIQQAGNLPAMGAPDAQGVLEGSDLSALFGIDLGGVPPEPAKPSLRAAAPGAAKPKRAAMKAGKTFTASELIARGVPRHMIQAWLASGVLLRTPQRGAYQATPQTEARIRDYVARRVPE